MADDGLWRRADVADVRQILVALREYDRFVPPPRLTP